MPTPGLPGEPSSLSAMARTGWMVETGNIMAGISQAGREAQGARGLILTSCSPAGGAKTRTARFPKKRAALGVPAQAGREGEGPRRRWKLKAPQAAFIFEV